MISAKFSRRFNLIALALLGFIPPAQAQDAGYAPPPMFDDMTPPMVRPEPNADGNIVTPRVSPRESPAAPGSVTTTTKTTPVPKQPVIPPAKPKLMAPIVEPEDVKKEPTPKKPAVAKPEIKKPSAPAPVPPKKPEVKKPEAKPVEAPKAEPKVQTPVAPVAPPAPKKKEEPVKAETPAPKVEPAKRDPKESAIQGPKTMPSIPTQSVDQQKTFAADNATDEKETMLERRQKEVAEEKKEEELKPVAVAPKANVAPASFDKNEQGALKKIIPFQQGQIGLSSAEIDPIAVGVNNELDGDDKEAWRVQIRSYATSYGTGVSSDKRIALSRALSLRTALIAQGVPAARIDVLAEGQSADSGNQSDRIDLYLYGPTQD